MSTPPGEIPESGTFAAEVAGVAVTLWGAIPMTATIRKAGTNPKNFEEGVECRVIGSPNATSYRVQ
jgi:hypothetical protein